MFKKRKIKKLLRHVLHESGHARHMREDIAPQEQLDQLAVAEEALEKAAANSDLSYQQIEAEAEHVLEQARVVYPLPKQPRARENVEILIVAVAVAMAFRAYFLQPFKIPTGSMQPTLYGITFNQQVSKQWFDVFPLNLATFILTGERYVEVKAADSGNLLEDVRYRDSQFRRIKVGNAIQKVRRNIPFRVRPGSYVGKGEIIASGRMRHGDHIFVNKVLYNFMRPKRGDVFVFKTRSIEYPGMDKDTFYIKRLAGLPGEEITITPDRYLVADNRKITEPEPFMRMFTDPRYSMGYSYATRNASGTVLDRPGRKLKLDDDEYLPLGDNTNASLDGRYFGGVTKYDVVGPAFAVYWPFGVRWGFVDRKPRQ